MNFAYVEDEVTTRKQTPQIVWASEHRNDGDSDESVPMADYSSGPSDDRSRVSVEGRPLRMIPTRGRGWRGQGMVRKAAGSQGASITRGRGWDGETATRDTPRSGTTSSSLSLLGGSSGIPWDPKAFSREVISSAIGGQLQHTWPTPDQGGNYRIKIERYFCLRRELNWCLPAGPGKGGSMFSPRPVGYNLESFPLFIREHDSKWMCDSPLGSQMRSNN